MKTKTEKNILNTESKNTFYTNVFMLKSFTAYMNRHVEVIRFEGICHLPKRTQRVVPVCLFKPERLVRFAAFLQGQLKQVSCLCGNYVMQQLSVLRLSSTLFLLFCKRKQTFGGFLLFLIT